MQDSTFESRAVEAWRHDDSSAARAFRAELVRDLAREVRSKRVLRAMARVPRHLFVPDVSVGLAYLDDAVSIGYGQTISQPLIVATMSEALELTGTERVLEIGTGCGYQAAVLSLLAGEVFTVECVRELAVPARARLARLGYDNVYVRIGDGYDGWLTEAPFDRILLTAAPEEVPHTLLDQLADGGILVLPVGPSDWTQRLVRYRKVGEDLSMDDLGGVRFVPMVHPEE